MGKQGGCISTRQRRYKRKFEKDAKEGKNMVTKGILFRIGVILTILMPCCCFAQPLPIQSSRTVPITTDEGSYMNIDVSPDGKTLLFDLLGEIFELPSTGG